ncbi:Hypothetical protein PHPALM_37201 [Phytophthora palmivora]|uniref:Uncharacterized protein n=1 Tax=Phytophthora palmivora TaxID=4796 RepID=A0A2P4WY06_9STRA|nr:Hypothetical protein PHPALM_37201 [Phytophthora palmivora]
MLQTAAYPAFLPGYATGTSSLDTGDAPAQTTPASLGESGVQADGDSPSVLKEQRALKDEVLQLWGPMGAQEAISGSVTMRSRATAPNAMSDLPPTEMCHLTTSIFPESSKGRSFGTTTGTPLSVMSDLRMRYLDCVKFQATPAGMTVIFSGRLGSRGLTLTHFKESTELETFEAGSSNATLSRVSARRTIIPDLK